MHTCIHKIHTYIHTHIQCSNVPWNVCNRCKRLQKTKHQSLKHAWAKRYGLDTMEAAINKGVCLCACACACALVCAYLRVVYQASKPSLCTLVGMEANILELFASRRDIFCKQGCLRRLPCLREHCVVGRRFWHMMRESVSIMRSCVCWCECIMRQSRHTSNEHAPACLVQRLETNYLPRTQTRLPPPPCTQL